jgi:hypothetical protein
MFHINKMDQLYPRVHAHTKIIFWMDKYFSNFKNLIKT